MDRVKVESRPRALGARPVRLAEAIDRLGSPDAIETFSVLTGAPVLAVDCRADVSLPAAAAVAAAQARLMELACPSVAITAVAPAPALIPFLERFDVLVTSDAELTAVLEAIASRPLAAMALILERMFDILKIPPADWVEQRLPGGWGVVGDDVVAGLYTCLILHVALRFFPGLGG